ncbi:Aste57867_20088 [Aphanomyces stellatus]|uniref:Aste57867_20088 protein n=1 Tax=Aphanomyces stellatus TaxID=120398 RepID=A0A485LE49_9STRA|nr:hypothetical protein As57867_020022 [Aphanomyces stellatus]VFT96783.1 Aste57867_20088 [Aphanomyces stellatus]
MTASRAPEIRYTRLVHACKKFVSTGALHAPSTDVSKYLQCVQQALRSIQIDDALVNSPFHDELLTIETDLKTLHASIAVESEVDMVVFPTPDELRERRRQTMALRVARAKDATADPMGAILSHMETKITSAWEDKNASLMDDDFMSYTADDMSLSADTKKPSISAIREQLGLIPSRSKDGASLSAAKSIEVKEQLEDELQALSSQLKEATKGLNQNLKDDAHLLDQVTLDAEANQMKLDEESRKLDVQLATGMTFMTTIYLVVGLFVVFIGMYIFMKVWSTRHYPVFG